MTLNLPHICALETKFVCFDIGRMHINNQFNIVIFAAIKYPNIVNLIYFLFVLCKLYIF